jgi:hypothetical protein
LVLRLIPLFVLGYALVYALGWIQLYLQPHPYRVASEWIFANIPKGSVLVGPHWDDRLPITIPGKEPNRTFVMEGREAELPFYERDTKDKVSVVLRRMAKADYIIFPTARISDSIPRIPGEYPYTTPLIQLLWAEKLGFTLEKTFKDRPSFLGLTFNDDLADESFSVYDHPKVVVFKNTGRLSEEQMMERVMNPNSYQPLPTMDQILLMDEGGWSATATVYNPNPTRLARTFASLLLLAASFWVLMGPFLSFLPDRGLGMSFLGGIALGGGLTWMCSVCNILPFNASSGLLISTLIVVSASVRFLSNRTVRRSLVEVFSVHGAYVLLSLFVGVVVVLATKAIFPSYFWGAGEFQQFALSFFARNETIPPTAGWNPLPESGSWYGPYLFSGWLVKLVGATGSFVYEVCFVMLGGAVGGLLYTAFSSVIRRPLSAVLLTLICIVPAIRGMHGLYTGYSGVDVAQDQGGVAEQHDHLLEWLGVSIKGAPLVVEPCDGSRGRSVALRAGLPRYKEPSGGEVACSLKDPDAVFQSMMAHGVSLLIVPRQEGEGGSITAPRELASKIAARSDLFAVLYSKQGDMVLAPAFSDYFPRVYNKPAPVE